jgi:hypothetical protein
VQVPQHHDSMAPPPACCTEVLSTQGARITMHSFAKASILDARHDPRIICGNLLRSKVLLWEWNRPERVFSTGEHEVGDLCQD